MAKQTVAQLQALNTANEEIIVNMRATIEALRAQLAVADAEVVALRAKLPAAPAPKLPRPPRVVPADELERVAKMAAAKELAMSSGRTTLALR